MAEPSSSVSAGTGEKVRHCARKIDAHEHRLCSFTRFSRIASFMMRSTCAVLRAVGAFALLTAATAHCHGPIAAIDLSPMGHGGPPSARGPSPVSPLWRANVMSAPVKQEPCDASPRPDARGGGSVMCRLPIVFRDSYAASLVQAGQDTAAEENSMLVPLADEDEGA